MEALSPGEGDAVRSRNGKEARRTDVIVVYKVDRLTRSLADFAKLVEMCVAYCALPGSVQPPNPHASAELTERRWFLHDGEASALVL
jgi:hypothetical protein